MNTWESSHRARRRRRLRWRQMSATVAVALIAVALYLLLSTSVTTNGAQEWIGGRDDTRDLLLPMGLFIAGMVGLAACLR